MLDVGHEHSRLIVRIAARPVIRHVDDEGGNIVLSQPDRFATSDDLFAIENVEYQYGGSSRSERRSAKRPTKGGSMRGNWATFR